MAHLTDMEELLSKVQSPLVKDYMREAMNCYMAGAYRGCIVLSYVALFDDLLEKLAQLGKVNAIAKKIHTDASTKRSDQEVFESYLIDQLASNQLLSGLDAAFLGIIRTIRNKSAHPSGHAPSPEESRFIFFEVISRFLSRPILSTTQLVDEILVRLKNTNFFPSSMINDVKDVVSEEIAPLHEAAIPQLIDKLANASVSVESAIANNAGRFLVGLAALKRDEVRTQLVKRLVQKKSDDPEFASLILRVLSADGAVAVGISSTYTQRLKSILAERIKEVKGSESETRFAHPASVLASLSDAMSPDQFLEAFKKEAQMFINKRPYSAYLLDAIKSHESLLDYFIEKLIKNAESSDFDTANEFARAIEDMDDPVAEVLTNEQAFQLVVAVIVAANWGAFGSKSLVKTKFSATPRICAKARRYTKTMRKAAREYFQSKLSSDLKLTEFVDKYLAVDEDL
ncbi:hypothetical protein [Photobacterium halotolerans]|uniref:Uncharacterized protein n=1 Tax=Photobacterium halotolerans TaxID=265726 RepID=A0A0F5V9S4_9GAMM|nr:hypothetical protein [Photobacterium halotolerans]KKC98822.1 hypothetical protein KY46_15915 [Photobacterium halotolerans]